MSPRPRALPRQRPSCCRRGGRTTSGSRHLTLSPTLERCSRTPHEGLIPAGARESMAWSAPLYAHRSGALCLRMQLLELKREEFAKRMAECDSRQSELKKKCKDLRKRVQTKEQEVQETRSKIDRATKKQAEEQGFQAPLQHPQTQTHRCCRAASLHRCLSLFLPSE